MCGRYTQTTGFKQLLLRFGVEGPEVEIKPRYNLAPTQDAPVITREEKKALRLMRWGLIPFWAREESIGNRMINAKSETLAEKPSFREPLERRRCLVPADGFYEWRREGGTKTPMRIILKGGEIFAFAGLWDRWENPEGKTIESFTIVTTQANDLLHLIHERMPAILRKEDEDRWLDPASADQGQLLSLLKPYPSGLMEIYAVSQIVNSPKNDNPSCIEQVS